MTGGQETGTEPVRSEGIPLGRIAGVPIILAWSWFVIAAFIVLVFGPQVRANFPELGAAGAYSVALGYALLLLVSVLVHELAHALTARAYHWPTAKIVLTLWGGHTQFGDFRATPGRSLLVALAGPAANFVLALLGLLVLPFVDPGSVGQVLARIFIWANVLVGIFNVLPGLPLDGGRIVETIVWKATGSQDRGTIAAGRAGKVIAVLLVALIFVPPYLRGETPGLQLVLVGALVAGFLWMGAGSAINNAKLRLRLPSVTAAALMHPAVSLVSGSPAAEARRIAAANPGAFLVVAAPTGQPEAVVDLDALAQVPTSLESSTPVNAVSRALAPGAYVPEAAVGSELVQYLAKLSGREYAVINREGQVTGLLDQPTVVAAITGKPVRGGSRPGPR